MHRLSAFCLLILTFAACPAPAQAPLVKVKIRAAVYDRDLNLKPVPHLELSFRSLDQDKVQDKDQDKEKPAPTVIQTTLDGTAETELPPGHYQVSTSKPLEFQGKTYLWDLTVQLSLPQRVLELSNDNAKVTDLTGGREALVDSLAEHFRDLKSSTVTVWQQEGHGTGLLVDRSGLIVTNQHVVDGHTYLAVQFDDQRKLAAEVLAEDKQKDVAVLRVNLANISDVAVAPIAQGSGALLEGERVFTIGNPLDKEKVLTTGVVSKVDRDSIISDISISAGNSGGALFNSSGNVVGITAWRQGHGSSSGLSGIVPIAEAADLLAVARSKAAGTPPSSRLLPVAPHLKYPIEALRAVGNKPWAKDIYSFKLGDVEVEIITPVTRYQVVMERASRAQKEREKRAAKSGAPAGEEHQPTDYETKFDSVVMITAEPMLKQGFWKSMAPGRNQVVMHFKSDFLKMRLLCGDNEIEPILPARFPLTLNAQSGAVRVDDSSFVGRYTYPPDAIAPSCKQVSVEVYLSKEPDKPLVKVLDPNAVTQIWTDFDPFRKMLAANPATPPK